MIRRRFLALSVAGSTLPLLPRAALAASPPVFAPGGVAINGRDPVAYFTRSAPVEGRAEFALEWMGATWHFASAGNRELFEADPEGHAPRYGGYCAYAVSKGAIAPTDPAAWTVHEGRLYLNFSLQVRDVWREDIPGNIARANENWPAVLDT